jgi:hypothetical protein
MAAIELPRIGAPQSKKRLPIRRRTAIDSDDHNRGSSPLCTFDKCLDDLPLSVVRVFETTGQLN